MNQFEKAVFLIRNAKPQKDTPISTKLQYYALYKQATEGNCKGPQPWAYQITERSKWDAWNSLKGLNPDEAKKQYILLVSSEDPLWEQNEVLLKNKI